MKVCSEHKRTVCRRINGARCDKESFLSVPQKMCPSAIFSLMQAILNSITFLQLCISQTIGNGKGYQTAANSVTVARGEDAEKERLNNGKYWKGWKGKHFATTANTGSGQQRVNVWLGRWRPPNSSSTQSRGCYWPATIQTLTHTRRLRFHTLSRHWRCRLDNVSDRWCAPWIHAWQARRLIRNGKQPFPFGLPSPGRIDQKNTMSPKDERFSPKPNNSIHAKLPTCAGQC